MKIAVTGASGQLGQLTIEKLKERTSKENLIALVRQPNNVTSLEVEARAFDYSKPEILPEALQGIDFLFLISGSEIGQREIQHKNVISAAKEANVKWIVYTSLLNAVNEPTSEMILAPEHIATEKAIKDSGLKYTILRNGWYTENYAGSIPDAVKAGAFIGSAGEGKISSASREDFAEAAAIVLTTNGHEGKIYELAGDDAYSLSDLADTVSKLVDKKISYKNLSEEEFTKALVSVGLPESFAKILADSDLKASKGALFSSDKTLSQLLGRPTTSLEKVVKRFL